MDTNLAPEPQPARRSLPLLLTDHHRQLQAQSRELLTWAYADDRRELAARWRNLEIEVLDHMAAEEELILPAYARTEPEDASQILDEHARIRALLTPIGVEVELHEIRIARLRRLIDALEAHARHEDMLMYPWAQLNLTQAARRQLFSRIGRWFIGG